MALTTITHRALAPDGRPVTVSCRTRQLQSDWFWHMRLTSKTTAIGVAVTGPDYFDHTVRVRGMRPSEEVTYGGRPFVLGVTDEPGSWMAAWKSTHHCLILSGAGPAPRIGSLIRVLQSLEITDRPEGLTVRPVPGSGVVIWGMSGVKFADSGMITIYSRPDAAGMVPDQAGLQVEHGEVWSKRLEMGGVARGRKFVHAGESTVCTVDDDLGRDPAVTAGGQAELIASLDVRWGG